MNNSSITKKKRDGLTIMAKKKNNAKAPLERLTGAFDMPKDIIFNTPRFIMLGNEEIYIENYRGIVSYSETHIKLNTTKMPVAISGADLSITQIAAEEITVCGKISSVEFS